MRTEECQRRSTLSFDRRKSTSLSHQFLTSLLVRLRRFGRRLTAVGESSTAASCGTTKRGPRQRADEAAERRPAFTGSGGRAEPGEVVERVLRGADYDRGRDLICFFLRQRRESNVTDTVSGVESHGNAERPLGALPSN